MAHGLDSFKPSLSLSRIAKGKSPMFGKGKVKPQAAAPKVRGPKSPSGAGIKSPMKGK